MPRLRLSLAGQILLLQLVVIVVAVVVGGVLAVRAAVDRESEHQRERVLSIAGALAESGEVRRAARRDDPSVVLQPLAERIRRQPGVAFVVFMSPSGVRHSHPNAARIGGRFVGTIAPAQRGRTFTETTTGTLGPSIRAVAPIRDLDGSIAGLVSVGVLKETIADQARDQLPALLAALAISIAVGGALSMLLARRLRRQTRGLDPDELAALYDHHDAVLHAIREGVVVVGDDKLLLANAEAVRLLGLRDDAVGQPIASLISDPDLLAAMRGESDAGEGLHLVGGRVLVTSERPAERDGRRLATVTTLRDRTELEGLVRELATVRGLAEALRAQAHESANELHTVVGLVELGRHADAISFATRRIGVTQDEVDLIQQRVGDPALAALLLAKAAACRERGVHLAVDDSSDLPAAALSPDDGVTIVGNLIDNALEALAEQTGGRISVLLLMSDPRVVIEVRDDGPGIAADALEHVFEPGWSTKSGGRAGRRGLGLALVSTAAERLGGVARAANDGGAVFRVELPVQRSATGDADRPIGAPPRTLGAAP